LVSGVVEYITLYYNCFHHQVLAMNDPIVCIFAGFDPSKNYLYCPHHSEFRNYSGLAWWYIYLQLVSGEVEYITL
jgi:hypothetical protein